MSVFDGEGDLYELRNYRTLRASFFEYDHAGRCMASTERAFTVSNGVIHYGAELSSYRYEYDVCNNLTKLTCSVAGTTWNTTYTYDKDNRPKTTTTWSGTVLTNTYDSLGRLTKRTWGLGSSYETRLEYWLNGDNRTTLLHRYYNGNDDPYVYGYDDNGNITSITQGSTGITYEYDAANRLTRENNGVTNETVTYEYDDFGNILNKKTYAYTTGTLPATPASTVNYTYANSGWKDQLTSYNGQTITYDAMGNPLTYRGYTFTWQGKQLMTSVNGSQTVSFEYNEDGLRQKKTVNGTETDYYYNGSVLIGMQRSGTRYLFSYDASGNVISVKYNNNEYYYVRNGQGDIVKLIDASGNTMVEYTYNTWGKKVTTTGSLAGSLGLIQPFRYRGYVYDYETGFYYLQSRYYDPTTGRFISADVLLSTGQGVLGHNCYAYCRCNPASRIDISGTIDDDIEVDTVPPPPQPEYTPTPIPDEMFANLLLELKQIVILARAKECGASPLALEWIEAASALIGKPYPPVINKRIIETKDMYHCAQVIQNALAATGISVGRSCSKQKKYFMENKDSWIYETNGFTIEDLQPGDLIYWKEKTADGYNWHGGLYCGNGYMIDSTRSGGGVAYRRVEAFQETPENAGFTFYAYARYIGR